MIYQQDKEGEYQARLLITYGPCPNCGNLHTWQPMEVDMDARPRSILVYLECDHCGAMGTVTIGKIEQ